MHTINFYLKNGPHGYFSNFATYPIELDGLLWPTSEHYYQAQKFVGTEAEAEMVAAIRAERSPMRVALWCRDPARPRRAGWEAVKDEAMRRAVRAKFTQHADLRAALLATGDAVLVEHTANDAYWGDGGDGSGKNMLGRLLMELRAELGAAVPS